MKSKLKNFEIASALGTVIFGSMLHFLYDWTGGWKPVALIAAVNESSWEHLKLAFWPAFIFATVAYLIFARKEQNFCFAQMKKLFLMPFLIVILFYGWLYFFPDNFIYDISIFVFSVVAGHFTAYKLETSKRNWGSQAFSKVMIIFLLLAFSLLTFFPPHNFLFRDPIGGGYGIIQP